MSSWILFLGLLLYILTATNKDRTWWPPQWTRSKTNDEHGLMWLEHGKRNLRRRWSVPMHMPMEGQQSQQPKRKSAFDDFDFCVISNPVDFCSWLHSAISSTTDNFCRFLFLDYCCAYTLNIQTQAKPSRLSLSSASFVTSADRPVRLPIFGITTHKAPKFPRKLSSIIIPVLASPPPCTPIPSPSLHSISRMSSLLTLPSVSLPLRASSNRRFVSSAFSGNAARIRCFGPRNLERSRVSVSVSVGSQQTVDDCLFLHYKPSCAFLFPGQVTSLLLRFLASQVSSSIFFGLLRAK